MSLMSPQELEAALRRIGAERYHNLHPFHTRLHGGKCSLAEVQAWALNRYYYQSMIPQKDATVLSRMSEPDLRREWRHRLVDHDGEKEGEGGAEHQWDPAASPHTSLSRWSRPHAARYSWYRRGFFL